MAGVKRNYNSPGIFYIGGPLPSLLQAWLNGYNKAGPHFVEHVQVDTHVAVTMAITNPYQVWPLTHFFFVCFMESLIQIIKDPSSWLIMVLSIRLF